MSVNVFPIQLPNRILTITFSLSILSPLIFSSQDADFISAYCTSNGGTIFSAARPLMVSLMASCVSTNPHHPNFRLLFMLIDFSNMETIKVGDLRSYLRVRAHGAISASIKPKFFTGSSNGFCVRLCRAWIVFQALLTSVF